MVRARIDADEPELAIVHELAAMGHEVVANVCPVCWASNYPADPFPELAFVAPCIEHIDEANAMFEAAVGDRKRKPEWGTFDVPVSYELAADTLANAIDSGWYTAWATVEHTFVHRGACGTALIEEHPRAWHCRVTDLDTGNAKRIGVHDIAKAIAAMVEDEATQHIAGRVLARNGDAETDDAVLQYAMFGEVMFG